MEVVEDPFYGLYYNRQFRQKCVLIVNELQRKRKISQKLGFYPPISATTPFLRRLAALLDGLWIFLKKVEKGDAFFLRMWYDKDDTRKTPCQKE